MSEPLAPPRKRIGRLRPGLDGEPRWHHPHGYTIVRVRRDWDWPRGAAGWTPKVSWEIRRSFSTRAIEATGTLRAARDWCDRHPRWPDDEAPGTEPASRR